MVYITVNGIVVIIILIKELIKWFLCIMVLKNLMGINIKL